MDWPITLSDIRSQESAVLNDLSAASDKDTPLAVSEILICGFPGQRLGEVIEFVRQSFVQAFGGCTVYHFNEVTDEFCDLVDNAPRPLLFWADCPKESAIDVARRREYPILMVDSEFDSVAREFIRTREASLLDTLRVLATCRMGWWQMAKLPQVRHIGPGKLNLNDVTASLMAWGFLADSTLLHGELHGNSEDLSDPMVPALSLSDVDIQAIADLAEFYSYKDLDDACVLKVPLNMLLDGAPPHLTLNGPIELVGRARALTFGPFLYLPDGMWQFTLKFKSNGNRSGNTIKFEIFVDGEEKCACVFDLTRDGVFEYSCEFFINNAWSPFEFRSHMLRGSIEGVVEFDSPILIRCPN